MSPEFQAPPTDMVRVVRNIIDGYRMGALRALAQDPVQNSIDAYDGGGGAVKVEYRIHTRSHLDGTPFELLTVTDSGTTGLRGAALSLQDLHDRAAASGQIELEQDENWAAWEAMGYTKAGEDKLGSRGQGKAAFLYHSRRPLDLTSSSGAAIESMVMLYDTLLEDGTYRLGVRLARPADLVRYPPFEGDDAIRIVQTVYESTDGSVAIPLELEPLTEQGSRIIVPFLSEEASTAFRDGEMVRWLERCWWRAIQIGRVEITVVTDEGTQPIGVPSWWRTEPWRETPTPRNVLVRENIRIEADSNRQIKRIVLLHDNELLEEEIENVAGPQYAGVQLLRGQQWIETIGTREFTEYIPADARGGFRGFVEFDREVEAELREVESPQHDTFHRRRPFVRQIALVVDEAVREFAGLEGWLEEAEPVPRDRTAEDVLRQVTELFVTGAAPDGRGDEDTWTCELELDYPTAETTRVDWDETLSNISVLIRHEPSTDRRDVRIVLVVVDPMGERHVLASRDRRTSNGSAEAGFEDFRVVRVSTAPRDIECPTIGRYRLRAECFAGETRVSTSSRNFWVRMDPPDPPEPQSIAVELRAQNADAERRRINDGEHLDVTVVVKNRGRDQAGLTVVASVGDLLLFDDEPVTLPGRLAGDQPTSSTLVTTGIEVRTTGSTDPELPRVVLDPGRHPVRVDVFDRDVVVASTSRSVWIEEDPEEGGPDLPFVMRPRDGSNVAQAVWELQPPGGTEPEWVLFYTTSHPLFRAAQLADAAGASGLAGRRMFFAEMVCGALIEWALSRFQEDGDEDGFQLLRDRAAGSSGPVWERYATCLELLIEHSEEPLEALRRQREAISLMIYVLQSEIAA